MKVIGYFSNGKVYPNKGLAKAADKRNQVKQVRAARAEFVTKSEKLAERFGKMLGKL